MASGPLDGVRIIEFAGIGPGPFCGMLLSDLGADVVRIDRAQHVRPDAAPNREPLLRGRRSVGVDLKHPESIELVLDLVERADAIIEGFRPGVMERLGLGPEVLLERNPKLVYGRMTGWGQDGPWANAAGHDINYIALGGALAHLGREGEKPTPPINLVGDFGGGALYLAMGLLAGIISARSTGVGQVVDAAMVDGTASLMTMFWGYMQMGAWSEQRGVNLLDTGAPFYDTYETADAKYVAIGPIEPQFHAEFMARTGLDQEDLPPQMDQAGYPLWRERLTQLFKTKTRDEWDALLAGTDACYAPVLTMRESAQHPHLVARGVIVEDELGIAQPAPAPRFSRTPGAIQRGAPRPGEHTDEVLGEWGVEASEVARLRADGAVA